MWSPPRGGHVVAPGERICGRPRGVDTWSPRVWGGHTGPPLHRSHGSCHRPGAAHREASSLPREVQEYNSWTSPPQTGHFRSPVGTTENSPLTSVVGAWWRWVTGYRPNPSYAHTTMLMSLPGTTIAFRRVFPSVYFWTRPSARAAASTSSFEASLGTVMLARTLPFT